ncbi:MAG TPA: DUF6390 family protein [Acidimicrobiales bacterium]|nr:DUF6390 family protein [Acidimicrobiales bacterium]
MSSGPVLFARYAYPPNALGLCGPADPDEMRGAAEGGDAASVASLARQFEGAWPYLRLIAGCNNIADPLDRRVVEAYWVGSPLLDRIPPWIFASSLEDRFRRRAGRGWGPVVETVPLGGVAHHSFHVFAVYPWLGMLRAGRSQAPLEVLDRCRIRWGTVERIDADSVAVRSRRLVFDGSRLRLGDAGTEEAAASPGLLARLSPGDPVSLHWDWVCDRLTPSAVGRLRLYTARNLVAVNASAVPGPAVACDRAG